jgi:hypothetical protein
MNTLAHPRGPIRSSDSSTKRIVFHKATRPDTGGAFLSQMYSPIGNSGTRNQSSILYRALTHQERTSVDKLPLQTSQSQSLDNLFPPPPHVLFSPKTLKPFLSWTRPEPMGGGLMNLGATCYMDASLQCLAYTPPLANYLIASQQNQHCFTCVISFQFTSSCSLFPRFTRSCSWFLHTVRI